MVLSFSALPALFTGLLVVSSSHVNAQPAITIYNQNFAVVRDTISLDLKTGVTVVEFADATRHLEPSSVILRDPAGKVALTVLEQNYRNDPVTDGLLLLHHEGNTIDFQTMTAKGEKKVVSGKVIRSGYKLQGEASQPVIEVDGKLQFSLPGQPLFPALSGDSTLKPTLNWKIQASAPGRLEAELAYITGGMTWAADYNIVSPEEGDLLDLVGWVTMKNQSGKAFNEAKIKLMAGDVSKIQPMEGAMMFAQDFDHREGMAINAPAVTEKSFDEYHLYTLERPTTLRDQETKQVEFVRAAGVKSQRVYIYDGLKVDWIQWRGHRMQYIRNNQDFGTESDTKVAVMREFKNTNENNLGMPLPKGRLRFYRQDGDQRLEFTGENLINHTPKDETIRVFNGNAFDLVGERRRTDWKIDTSKNTIDESFEIKLRNHKKEAVEIRIVEHLYRWFTWEITANSDPFLKTAAQKMEFRVQLKPDEERVATYTVHYSW